MYNKFISYVKGTKQGALDFIEDDVYPNLSLMTYTYIVICSLYNRHCP